MDPGHVDAMRNLEDRRDWPDTLRAIADLIGPELALQLAEDCGGVDIYIPRTATPGHLWARCIGIKAFEKLTQVFGGERVSLPRGRFLLLRKRQIIELAEEGGLSNQEIALRARTTERNVRRVLRAANLRAHRVDSRQQKLF